MEKRGDPKQSSYRGCRIKGKRGEKEEEKPEKLVGVSAGSLVEYKVEGRDGYREYKKRKKRLVADLVFTERKKKSIIGRGLLFLLPFSPFPALLPVCACHPSLLPPSSRPRHLKKLLLCSPFSFFLLLLLS